MTVKIFVEGGGHHNKDLATRCRQGFREFFRKAGFEERMPTVLRRGSRQQAFEDFCIALDQRDPTQFVILLVDSEAPLHGNSPWDHVRHHSGDRRQKPSRATDDHLHFMVQTMEAWFFADKEALAEFYKGCFRISALSNRRDVENIPKRDLFAQLSLATQDCLQKGAYSKGDHSFAILASVDPAKVKAACPSAARLLDLLDRLL